MAKVKGGDKIAPALRAMTQKLSTSNTVAIGFLEGAKYPNGTPVALIGAIQNFGAPNRGIPPRPFFSNMIVKRSPEWGKLIGDALIAAKLDAGQALNAVGAIVAGQLKESIIDTNSPPLSPVTLMLRKMRHEDPGLIVSGKVVGEAARRVAQGESVAGVPSKPLIDTAFMIKSVAWEVKK